MPPYAMMVAMKEPHTDGAPNPARKGAKPAPEEPRRTNGPRAIADLMPRIGNAAFRRFGFVQSSIVTRWAEIVGERTAAITSPDSIRFPVGKKAEGTLSLTVMSGHAPIVQHIIPDIIERVNRFFGYTAIVRVALRQGEIAVREPERRPPPANLRPIPTELGDSLRDIGDPELRAVLEAMAQGLANGPAIGKIG
jgi:hypothetical protein